MVNCPLPQPLYRLDGVVKGISEMIFEDRPIENPPLKKEGVAKGISEMISEDRPIGYPPLKKGVWGISSFRRHTLSATFTTPSISELLISGRRKKWC
jgi:hypothetical protein